MYSDCNVLPSLDYKRKGKRAEKVSRFVKDGVLSDWVPSFLLRYHCSLQVSWKVASTSRKALPSIHLARIFNEPPYLYIAYT